MLDVETEDRDKAVGAAAPVHTSIEFKFTMESLIVDLFTEGLKEVCLCQFIFLYLSLFILCLEGERAER
jgi:hypothetical protein